MGKRLPPAVRRHARQSQPLAFWLGTWFGCGLVPYGPGTAGTLAAIPLFLLLRPWGLAPVVAVTALVTVVGIWAANRVVRATDTPDPQLVVIDETAGMLITLLAAPLSWPGVAAAFVLFRVLDMTKPFPCRWCERNVPSGAGVMLDDVCAGIWGALMLLGARAMGWL